jgi:hypothetical protein
VTLEFTTDGEQAYRSVCSILESGLDRAPVLDDSASAPFHISNRKNPRPAAPQLTDALDAVPSQLAVETWHAQLGDATEGDALQDLMIHSSYLPVFKGPKRRKEGHTADKLDSSDDR